MIYEWLTVQEKVLKIREMQIKTIIHLTCQDGYYQKDNKSPKVIVTSGVNSWGPPQRIGTNSEIVKINIKFN